MIYRVFQVAPIPHPKTAQSTYGARRATYVCGPLLARVAVEQELSRILDDEGNQVLEGGREVASVDGGAIELATGSRTEAIGTQIARVV